MRFAPALLIALIALPVPAMAGFNTGNDLLKECTQSRNGYCTGYAAGVADAIMEQDVDAGRICVRESMTVAQTRDVLIKWLEDNPGRRDYSASSIARVAFREAFPCP